MPAPVERDADVVDDDRRAFAREAQRELATDAPPGPGDDRDAPVEQAPSTPTAAVAEPVIALTPSWFATMRSRSTRCSPPSSRLPVTTAVHVSTSPGHTCLAKRTWSRRIASAPNQSFTHAGREAHREHPVAEHRRVADLGRDRVVVVHRVEVAARARVPHEHRAGQRRELLGRVPRRRTRRRMVVAVTGSSGS